MRLAAFPRTLNSTVGGTFGFALFYCHCHMLKRYPAIQSSFEEMQYRPRCHCMEYSSQSCQQTACVNQRLEHSERDMPSQAPDRVGPMPGILDSSTCRTTAGRYRNTLSVETPRPHTCYHIPWDCTLFTELVCHVARQQKLHCLISPTHISHESLNGKQGQSTPQCPPY